MTETETDTGTSADAGTGSGSGSLIERLLGRIGDLVEFEDSDVDEEFTDDVAGAAGTSDGDDEAVLRNLTEELVGAEGDEPRRRAALAVADHLRERFGPAAFASIHRVPDEHERTAMLGRLAVDLARIELLTGWAHHGGVDRRTSGWFEHDGPNRGAFPDHYQREMAWGSADAAKWCTMFVGTIQQQLGFRFNPSIGAAQARSIFWSTHRLVRWTRDGTNLNDRRAAQASHTVADGGASGHIGVRAWSGFHDGIDAGADASQRLAALGRFFEDRFVPQPGDIVQFQRHTMLVEHYDAATGSVTTIEGNSGDAIRSRVIDLTVAGARPVTDLVRIGADFFGLPEGTDSDSDTGAGATADGIGRAGYDALRRRTAAAIGLLVGACAERGWIRSSDPDAPAVEWLGSLPAGSSIT